MSPMSLRPGASAVKSCSSSSGMCWSAPSDWVRPAAAGVVGRHDLHQQHTAERPLAAQPTLH